MEKSCKTCKYHRLSMTEEPCLSCNAKVGGYPKYEIGTAYQVCGCDKCEHYAGDQLAGMKWQCRCCHHLTGPDEPPTMFEPNEKRMNALCDLLEETEKEALCDEEEAEPDIPQPATDAPKDAVNHPGHYTFGSIEVIDYIRDKLTPEEFQGYCEGNVLKYVSRWRHKGGVEDLKKAKVYLQWMIESAEKQEIDAVEADVIDDAVRMLEEAEERK